MDMYVSRKKGAIAAVTVAVTIGIMVAILQPRSELPDDGTTVIANATEPREAISVLSARSAFPFVQRWISQYNNDESSLGNVEVSYYLDKPDAPSDLTIVGEAKHADGLRSVPVSPQAIAIVYNIPSFPDVPSGMKLNSTLLSMILEGTITRWDDPAIKSLNQDLNLPAESIILVHERSNVSGLALIERYLSADIAWPGNSTTALGPDELTSTIRKTPYSIGYVDFSYAIQTRMTFAAIANAHGEYIMPSMDSIQEAVNSSMVIQNATGVNAEPPYLNATRIGNGAYPITGLYYATFPDNASNATLNFVGWMVERDGGQQVLSEVQYPPIYRGNESLATHTKAAIE
jgi:phosphate transport system substrate-binding protein